MSEGEKERDVVKREASVHAQYLGWAVWFDMAMLDMVLRNTSHCSTILCVYIHYNNNIIYTHICR